MTPEQAAALIVAVTGLIAAVGVCAGQLAALHAKVNGMTATLLDAKYEAGHKDGELAGRDFMRRLQSPPTTGDTHLGTD